MKKLLAFAFVAFFTTSLWAVKSGDNARAAATRWGGFRHGFGGRAGAAVERVARHSPAEGDEFFSVKFAGGGTAFVAGDGEDELPIAFTASTNDFSVIDRGSPLWALLERDAKARKLAGVRRLPKTASGDPISSDSSVSDMRVPSLVRSRWSQGGGIYNYYTPKSYVCGCVATAMAQVMRYFEYPVKSCAQITHKCSSAGAWTNLTTQGGVYDWANMPYVPSSPTAAQKKAIGKLTSDAGISVFMAYSSDGSGAYNQDVQRALCDVFGYRSALYLSISKVDSVLEKGVCASLDAGYPVIFGITDSSGRNGHCIVGDGYGYEGGLPYVHLNFGWSGDDDMWYNLPNIGTDYSFSIVDEMVTDIFPTNSMDSAIMSGRITGGGSPCAGAAVSVLDAASGETVATVRANEYGVWGAVVTAGTYRVVAECGGRSGELASAVTMRGQSVYTNSCYYSGFGYYATVESFTHRTGLDVAIAADNEVAMPVADIPAGTIAGSAYVTLTCATAGAQIRYTLDGTEPTATSTLYSGPVFIDRACTLKAKAFKSGLTASAVMTVVYGWHRAPKTFTVAADGSGDFVSLSNAVWNAVDGDVFRVRPGKYRGFVEVPKDARVVVESTDGPAVTIIDGDQRGCCFYGWYSPDSIVSGFTLTNGWRLAGGGICGGIATNCVIVGCWAESGGGAYGGTVIDCEILGCDADYDGGGAYDCTVSGSIIRDCSAEYGGGAASSRLNGCYLYGNYASASGGGAQMSTLEHCTVYGNSTDGTGGGVECYCDCYDSIIWGNSAVGDDLGNWEEWTDTNGEYHSTYMEYCCAAPDGYKAGDGCVNADPKFYNAADRDFRLMLNSPCLGTASDGGNMGAYRGSGEAGCLLTVQIVGCGSVDPASTNVAPGGAVTFYASEDHPFEGFYVNGVKVSSDTEFTWSDVEEDGTLTAVFLSTDFFVDAAAGSDDNRGWSWGDPLASVVEAAARAADGETVFVKPGVYEGYVEPKKGAAVRFVAIEGPEVTSIFVPTSQAYCCFYGYESPGSMICGFTLTNGWDNYGGGIWGGTASNCVIRDCYAQYGGGGAAGADLLDCVIDGCRANYGGGAYNSMMTDCVIANCAANTQGGGASCSTLVGCTVRGNSAGAYRTYWGKNYSLYTGGGLDCQCLCTNTVAWGNYGPGGVTDDWEWYRELYRDPRGNYYGNYAPTFEWCCTSDRILWGENSITNDPEFLSVDALDPRLCDFSPCIGAGYGGANVGAYRGPGVVTRLPEIDPRSATAAEVAAAVAQVEYADQSVKDGIGTSAETYAEFQTWSTNGLRSQDVLLSTQAFESFLVREIVAAPTLLAGGTDTELEVSAPEPTGNGKCSVTISLVDGDTVIPLRAAKEAFAAKTQLGSELLALAPADPSKVTAASAADGKSVTLTVEPPADAKSCFMRFKLD